MKDLDKTEANKALVRNFVQDVLMGQHPENLTHYFDGNSYIQHNVSIADGLDGLGAALAAMAEQGIKMEYFTIHKILGCGNFVLAVSEGAFAGKQTIAPESEWKHQNGKFNF